MTFEVIHHPGDAIIERLPMVEVIYPANATAEDVAEYDKRARVIIDAQRRRPFCCLADQRALRVMPPELVEVAAALNAYATERGMTRTARLVSSAIAGLQAHRLAHDPRFELRAFDDRDEAIAWLHQKRT
jgi:hypothetical protein